MYRFHFLMLLMAMVCSAFSASPIGVPVDGMPGYQERTVYMFINAARCDPPQFGSMYGKAPNPLTAYAVRAPFFLHHDLNRAARFHSNDMKSCGTMSHTSCDGTSLGARLRRFIDKPGAECIAMGQRTPLAAVDTWLHSNAGHRDALMSRSYTDIGCGYASGNWWTTTFSSLGSSQSHPVYGGSHHFPVQGTIEFILVYYTKSTHAAGAVTLVLDNGTLVMENVLGNTTHGAYHVTAPSASSCRFYHFELVDASGKLWRYPETGRFMTYGEGSCAQDYSSDASLVREAVASPGSARLEIQVTAPSAQLKVQGITRTELSRIDIVALDGKTVRRIDRSRLCDQSTGGVSVFLSLPPGLYSVVLIHNTGCRTIKKLAIGR